ncbi:MAG: type II toxin-antitoxin system RelE/ParE family toxin [Candidatus Sulfotelmatobacter sp.]
MAETSPPDVVFVGDSRTVIRGFPKAVRENFGGELQRVQNGEIPLDSGSMAPTIPGVFELRDADKDLWYRVFYCKRDGVVYVLHCFTKKTNKTSQRDIEIGQKRFGDLKQQLTKAKKH